MNIATHILLATDFSETNTGAVTMGGELTRRFNAKLTVLRVHGHPSEPPEACVPPENLVWSEDLDAEAFAGLKKLRDSALADIEGIVLAVAEDGSPPHSIYDYAAKHGVDLIVMGSHGRTGLSHLFHGSVVEKVLRHAPCPVFVVPHREAVPSEDVRAGRTFVHEIVY